MIRKLTRKKKRERKEANYIAVKEIYGRALQGGSDAYLVINQESEPERIAKLKSQAKTRRDRRNAKRLKTTIDGHSDGQSDRGLLRSANHGRSARAGKIRGFARKALRAIAKRSNRRATLTA